MKTKIIGMVPLVLIAATAFSQGDDRAVPRGGGSPSGGQSDAGSRHSGGSTGGSVGASSTSGSQGGSSASGDYFSPQSDAASRRPRPGTGTGTRGRYGNDRDHYSYPYSGYYYDPYFYGWGHRNWYGYGLGYGYGYGAYGYGYGDYYGYYPSLYYGSYRYRAGNIAQIRTLIEPNKSRVYVDGYYAGIADDFDGLFQRLNVSPGRHDITLKLEGYTSHTFQVYAGRDQTLKLRWDMVRGGGETRDSTLDESDRRTDRHVEFESDRDREEMDREPARDRKDSGREVDSERSDQPSIQMPQAGRGEVIFDILPLDASVYIDGEFHGKASQVTRVPLPFGRHRVEVVRPGYLTEETEINVDAEGRKVVVKLDRR